MLSKVDELAEKARRYFENAEYERAIKYYKKALELRLDKEGFKVLKFELGFNLAAVHKYQEAVETLEEILNLEIPPDILSVVYLTLGNSYLALIEYENAFKNYNLALRYATEPENRANIMLMLGITLYFMKDFDQALTFFARTGEYLAKFKTQQLFEYYYYSGMTHLNLRNYDEARKNLFRLPDYANTTDEYAMYYLALAIYYNLTNNFEEMNKYCDIALTYESNQSQKDLLMKFKEEYLRNRGRGKRELMTRLFRKK